MKPILVRIASVVLGAAASGLVPSTRAAPRPNILFIMSDDHAAHALSSYGSVINKTPHLDRIATNGMRFTRCFVNNSICTPSRAAILTGKYSHLNGVTVFNRFDGSQPHLVKYLQASGYETAIVGKWHLFSDPTGFDYWNILPGQGLYNDPVMIENGKTNKLKGYTTDLITEISLDWLKRRDTSKPFCLMSQPKAPHREWTPPPRYTNLYADIDLPLPATFNDDYAGRSRAAAEATMRMRDLRRSDLKAPVPEGLSPAEEKKWRYQRYIKDYLRCIAAMDEGIGRLLDYLEESGLATNTIVIYTSDQGFFLGDHGWFDKRFMYEESLRMPLLVSWPGRIKPGVVNDTMVMNLDFAPTLMEAAGLSVPADMQGRSLLPLFRGERPADWRTAIYYRYYHYPGDHQVQPHYGIRTDRHKLIYFNRLDEWELYDLDKDPREMNNVAARAEYAGTLASLKEQLARLKISVGDKDQFTEELSNGEQFQPVPLELAFRPDFAKIAGGTAPNAAAGRHPLNIGKASVVAGRKGMAVKLAGEGLALASGATSPDPSRKPLTVGAWCRPDDTNGVIISMGGAAQGFALYLKDGVPHFAVRAGGQLSVVKARKTVPPGEWVHIAGLLNARAEISLLIDGAPAGSAKSPPIGRKPNDPLAVGDDPGSRVVGEDDAKPWRGLIEDLRIYWGVLDRDAMDEWAKK